MLPGPSIQDRSDVRGGDAVLGGQFSLADAVGRVSPTNLSNLVSGELDATVQFTGPPAIHAADSAHRLTIQSDMRPSLAANDDAHGLPLDAEPIGEGLLGECPGDVEGADLGYLISSQLRSSDTFAPRPSLRMGARSMASAMGRSISAASDAISRVVGAGAVDQMVPVATRRVVAGVAGHQADRITTVEQEERHAVGFQVPPSDLDLAVAARELTEFPRPAFVGTAHIDMRPKAGDVGGGQFWNGLRFVVAHTQKYTVPTGYGAR